MKRKRRDRSSGFALVEAIAVLALSALVMLALFVATDLVTRNSAAAARRANDLEMLATGLAAVRRDLEGALYAQPGAGTSSPVLFIGQTDGVGFVAAGDGSARDEGERLIWIETRYQDGEGALVRSSARYAPGVTSFADVNLTNSALLAVGPWRYQFSYALGPAPLQWKSEWGNEMELPAAVRLDVVGENGRVLPALVVRVHVDTRGCGQGGCEDEEEATGVPLGEQ